MTTTDGPTGAGTTSDDVGVERAEEFAREHPALVELGRVGWVAKGVVYLLTGLLALAVTRAESGSGDGTGGEEASQSGAVAQIAESPGGRVLLVVLAAGLVVYSVWRIVSTLLPASSDAASWLSRAGYLVSAGTYLLLAWAALTFVVAPRGRQQSEDSKVESFTADVLAQPFGRVMVFVVGLAVLGVGGMFAKKAWTADFRSQLAPGGVGPVRHDVLISLGRVGWLGRAGMMALIGFFLCLAAWLFDADEAQGLDGSLRKAATSTVGTVFVFIVSVGLLVYGAFCVLSAPRRLLVAVDR